MGMGSILGTGVFVSLGIAAGIAGPSVTLAVAIAALVAICNGLSAAQLAASHPVSGGTYEYGYRYLTPTMGFTAGWLFLLAKTASAATAALGAASYGLSLFGLAGQGWDIPLALGIVLVLTGIVWHGIQRSHWANTVMVSVTLLALGVFVVAGWPQLMANGTRYLTPFFPPEQPIAALLQASALMFVAYTGYGRITTMGEEVHHPERTIPRAIITTLGLTLIIYLTVALVGVGAIGTAQLGPGSSSAIPLVLAAQRLAWPGVSTLVAIGAVTAMLGVLLNLILGLSRVLLAMGRRGDMPHIVAQVNQQQTSPAIAVVVMGTAIALLVLIGNVKTTWSFSAFSVLVYYALTNLAALQLPPRDLRYPRWTTWAGLIACLTLAFWVDWQIWLTGIGLIALGLLGRQLRRSRKA